jgi:hypothetical protein
LDTYTAFEVSCFFYYLYAFTTICLCYLMIAFKKEHIAFIYGHLQQFVYDITYIAILLKIYWRQYVACITLLRILF